MSRSPTLLKVVVRPIGHWVGVEGELGESRSGMENGGEEERGKEGRGGADKGGGVEALTDVMIDDRVWCTW